MNHPSKKKHRFSLQKYGNGFNLHAVSVCDDMSVAGSTHTPLQAALSRFCPRLCLALFVSVKETERQVRAYFPSKLKRRGLRTWSVAEEVLVLGEEGEEDGIRDGNPVANQICRARHATPKSASGRMNG